MAALSAWTSDVPDRPEPGVYASLGRAVTQRDAQEALARVRARLEALAAIDPMSRDLKCSQQWLSLCLEETALLHRLNGPARTV
jgi:hypothetical protein